MNNLGTKNWPVLIPIVQGMMNSCVKRNYTRSPYEMVYGVIRRDGYRNKHIPNAVLRILTNENGLRAVKESGMEADLDTVTAAVLDAQEGEMSPAELDSSDEGEGRKTSPRRRKVTPGLSRIVLLHLVVLCHSSKLLRLLLQLIRVE